MASSSIKAGSFPHPLGGGKYELLRPVGAGAMGTVYQARHVELDRIVAIKVLSDDLSVDVKATERLRREAQAASLLQHPNSVQVLDFGSDEGRFFIVMEFLEGQSLHELLVRVSKLDAARAASILAQVLGALQTAHDQGIVHRDMKPENIMLLRRVDDEGNDSDVVKVCDFGIAKRAMPEDSADRPALTDVGTVIGTPAYMSPEQARGKDIDARSDLYSCGVVLYRTITGQTPFHGSDDIATLMSHVLDVPPAPRSLEPSISAALEAVILKALAKSPDARYQTAREMRRAILEGVPNAQRMSTSGSLPLSSGEGVGSPLTTDRTTFGPPAFTREAAASRKRAVWIGAVLLALVVGSVALWRSMNRPDPEPSKPAGAAELVPPSAPTGPELALPSTIPTPAVAPAIPPAAPDGVVASAPVIAPQTAESDSARSERRDVEVAAIAPHSEEPPPKGPKEPIREPKGPKPARPEVGKPDPVVVAPVIPDVPKPIPTNPVVPDPVVVHPKPPDLPVEVKPVAVALTEASASVGKVEADGSLPSSELKRVIDRSRGAFEECFRTAAASATGKPGSVSVRLTVDEDGLFRDVTVSGGPMAGVDACVKGVVGGLRSRTKPDTGTVSVRFKIYFKGPESP